VGLQGGNLSGPLALPNSGGIIAVHLLFSQDITIMSSKLAGRASDPLRLPPCTISANAQFLHGPASAENIRLRGQRVKALSQKNRIYW